MWRRKSVIQTIQVVPTVIIIQKMYNRIIRKKRIVGQNHEDEQLTLPRHSILFLFSLASETHHARCVFSMHPPRKGKGKGEREKGKRERGKGKEINLHVKCKTTNIQFLYL